MVDFLPPGMDETDELFQEVRLLRVEISQSHEGLPSFLTDMIDWKKQLKEEEEAEAAARRAESTARRKAGQAAIKVKVLGEEKRRLLLRQYGRGEDMEILTRTYQITPETIRNIACKARVKRPWKLPSRQEKL